MTTLCKWRLVAGEVADRWQRAARRATTWAMSPISSTSGRKNSSISAATLSIITIFLFRRGFQCSGACSTRS